MSLALFRVKKNDKLESMYHKSIIMPSPSLSILTHDLKFPFMQAIKQHESKPSRENELTLESPTQSALMSTEIR